MRVGGAQCVARGEGGGGGRHGDGHGDGERRCEPDWVVEEEGRGHLEKIEWRRCPCMFGRNYFTDDTAGRFRDDMFNPLAVLHLVLYIDGLICTIVQESSKSIVCIAALFF